MRNSPLKGLTEKMMALWKIGVTVDAPDHRTGGTRLHRRRIMGQPPSLTAMGTRVPESLPLAQLALEPGAGEYPIALGRRLGDFKYLSRLLNGQSDEVAQAHQTGLARIF